jgi:hypothetical protein
MPNGSPTPTTPNAIGSRIPAARGSQAVGTTRSSARYARDARSSLRQTSAAGRLCPSGGLDAVHPDPRQPPRARDRAGLGRRPSSGRHEPRAPYARALVTGPLPPRGSGVGPVPVVGRLDLDRSAVRGVELVFTYEGAPLRGGRDEMHRFDDPARTIPRHTLYAQSCNLAGEHLTLGVGRDVVVRGDRAPDKGRVGSLGRASAPGYARARGLARAL